MIAKAMRPLREASDGPSIRIEVIGPGATRLPASPSAGVVGIIMAGLAGGLDPSLRTGDLVIDDQSTWRGLKLACRTGQIHSAAGIIATPQQKAALFRDTGALVVDMENAAARKLAAEWNVPFLGIRAVADSAGETLDPALLRMTDSSGRVKPIQILAELCRRPNLLPGLWQMNSRASAALRSLSLAVRQVVTSSYRTATSGSVSAPPVNQSQA
ncbi:MAG: hypothetical protein QOF78_4618 [Phycisphaerales bacterium]|nr:hypothetical protein [Phycisphaerales bacterium]